MYKKSTPYLSSSKPINYFHLLKPRVMVLVIFTVIISMSIAPGVLHPYLKLLSLLSIALGSGAAGCLNMWYERFTDALMKRTEKRPLPKKIIESENALAFGAILGGISIVLLGFSSNIIAALYLLFTMFFYVVIYTILLKPRTPHSIVIGGIAGALPPVVAWQAVAPGWYLMPWLMFFIIFFWTPAHFWALSLTNSEEYKKAKIPVLPNTHGIATTKRLIVFYTLLTVASSLFPSFLDILGNFYTLSSVTLGVFLIYYSIKLYRSTFNPIKFFYITIAYLFFLFLSILIDNFI